MRLLSVGSTGEDVKKVQAALNAIYEEQLDTDGKFGPHTEEMVMAFQADNDLDADGLVGPETWAKLFNEVVEDNDQEEDVVTVGGAIRQSQLSNLYGKPRDPAPYLKVMDFTEFKDAFAHVKDFEGHSWSCRIYGHELMEAPLRKAFAAVVSRGLAKELKTFDGCVCIRPMTGGGGMSVHSWGMAVDLNAGTNGYGHQPSLSTAFVRCFTEQGLEWGGSWHTPDGMHFQLPSTRG